MLWIVAVCLIASGAFVCWLALRLRAGRVPRSWQASNWPLRHATSSEAVWRTSNARMWWLGLLCGLVLLAAGAGTALVLSQGGSEETIAVLVCLAGFTAIAIAIVQVVAVERCARRLSGSDHSGD